jgi:hypothetical protein
VDVIAVRATLFYPALTNLRALTGQDFGHNLAKWREWNAKQP